MKKDNLSTSVAIILGKGKPKAESGPAEAAEEEGDEGLTALGKALRMALESKDDAALGRALKDAHEYCQPDPAGEDE